MVLYMFSTSGRYLLTCTRLSLVLPLHNLAAASDSKTKDKSVPTQPSLQRSTSLSKRPKESPPPSPERHRLAKSQKKQSPRNPGVNLSAQEKEQLLETVAKHHPKKSKGSASSKGKNVYPSAAQLYKSSPLPPKAGLSWSAEPCFDNAAFFLVRDGWLEEEDLFKLAKVDAEYESMSRLVPTLKEVDFSSLAHPRLEYADQHEIDHERVIKLTACAVHYGLDFGLVVRFLGHEYVGASRDVAAVQAEIAQHISPEDMAQITRILTFGCPAELNYELPIEQKIRMLRRGNQKSVLMNHEEVVATMNKEERQCHVAPFLPFVCRFCYTAQAVSQGMVIKPGSSPRLVWDASTMLQADDIVMNNVLPLENEAPITFGRAKSGFARHLYQLRATYPNEEIDIAWADIKSAHRYPRFQPSLAAAFGFMIMGYYFIATAMVFGAVISATSWEPFRRAIETMTRVYSLRTDLADKHKHYLDMISLKPLPTEDTEYVKAIPDSLNPVVVDEEGRQMPIPNFIYVDDCLLACIRRYTRHFLAACIEAIFVVLGRPDTTRRHCPLALDKWTGMNVGHRAILLGLIWDSRRLIVGMTREYLDQVLEILNRDWPAGFTSFKLKDIITLAGKLARLGEAAPWVFHLMTHIYSSIAYALRKNEKFLLGEDRTFISLIKKIKALRKPSVDLPTTETNVEHMNFYLSKAAKRKFKSSEAYKSNQTLNEEIELLRSWLDPSSDIMWETPIHHIIEREPFAEAAADACLIGAGGFSLILRVWWHYTWPSWVINRTKLFLENNKSGNFISINVLEYIAVIINFAAAITIFESENVTDDPYPVLLNWCDNKSAISWTNHHCKESPAGRALGRMFCMLLINSDVGINAKYISSEDNVVADTISRISAIKSSNPDQSFDYSKLKQTFPQLKPCREFQPSRELLSLIWRSVQTKKSPSLKEIQELKQRGLGKLSS